ncbi:ankyrin repeat domain-containing protein 12 [Drosophila novamexicana]|uniref:ankyrin repeat domain-containing protein 12 n=1 Tax=Drosophila novamexicana TaxID=47314 RepID=UPI0011E5B4E3|nr:ankyrin repeat domain-containing protein 12 [Drosophila novamexicana]
MSVHYKFKSTLNFDTITFDGLHISVADLKREIILQKRLGKVIDFDLQITNAQTKEEYKDDNFLIPKNTTLIIARIPVAHPIKKGWDPPPDNAITNVPSSKPENLNMDLFKMQGSEEEKIQAMMMQSTADYDPKTYHRIKGQSQIGEVPASYRCNKCKRGGHWIKNCSFSSGKEQFEVKRNTGIPRSFRGKPEISTEQETSNYIASNEKDQEIPEDLICGICRNIFVDAVMIPCCGSSFCDDCVRNSLLESEDSECPDCKEKNCSPGSLIPNRFLRNSVNVYKNETLSKLGAFKSVSKISTAVEKKEIVAREQDDSNPTEPLESVNDNVAPTNTIEDQNISKPVISNTDSSKKEKDKFDSDYEDNITIKMPQKENDTNFVSADTNKEQVLPSYSQTSLGNNVNQRHEVNFEYKPDHEIKQPPYARNDNIKPQNERSLLPTPIGNHHKYPTHHMNEQREQKSIVNPDQSHRINHYKPTYIQMPRCPTILHMSPYNNGYNNMAHRPPISFGHYQNQPVHHMNPSYISTGNININPTQTFQSSNLASIYQGVAAKVGTGLIDDPLEAFNRIMKEKEKLKVDRRRSPGHHRSRSPGRLRHRFKSPVYDRGSSREIMTNEKRARSRERKREYSYERRQSRVTRHSSNGSNSPSDKKKRYVHHRSPSPRPGYKPRTVEKSVSKPYGTKTETVEPPPPGFESLQIESLADNDVNINNKTENMDIDKSVKDENTSLKRQRHYSKNVDVKAVDNTSRSLTPPAKSKTPKVARTECTETYEGSPKTPDRRDDSKRIEKYQSTQLYSPDKNKIAVQSQDHLESINNMEKENNIKLNLKERKKKKKDKSERKKNKKEKRDKKDKNKKGYLEGVEPTPEKGSGLDLNMDACDSMENGSNNLNPKISDAIDQNALHRKETIVNMESSDQDLNRENMSSNISEANDVQISKWEMDDNNLINNLLDPCKKMGSNKIQEHSEITSDVIRKAENAIFAKAINAIRPVEFKVVIDSKHSSKDPSLSYKSNHKDRSHSPKSLNKSVKERLGNKVVSERNYSSERSKNYRRDSSVKNVNDEKYKYNSTSYNSRKKEKDSKERVVTAERKFDDHRNRSSHDRDFGNTTQKESHFSESHKNKPQFKDKLTSKNTRSERKKYDADRNTHTHFKSVEPRLISSIASRPCRPDNPFRKFDENNSCSNKVPKFDSLIKDVTPPTTDPVEYKKRKDKKIKKLKSLKKCSSTESVRSEKQKDVKSKKKKILKKKKKSRK